MAHSVLNHLPSVGNPQEKHGGMQSADFASVKTTSSGKGFTSVNQSGVKGKSKAKK